jgi:hypothetical protein
MLHATLTTATPRRSRDVPVQVRSPLHRDDGPFHLVSDCGSWTRQSWPVLSEAVAVGEALRSSGGWVDAAGDLQPVPSLGNMPTRRQRVDCYRQWAVLARLFDHEGAMPVQIPGLIERMHEDMRLHGRDLNDRRTPAWAR